MPPITNLLFFIVQATAGKEVNKLLEAFLAVRHRLNFAAEENRARKFFSFQNKNCQFEKKTRSREFGFFFVLWLVVGVVKVVVVSVFVTVAIVVVGVVAVVFAVVAVVVVADVTKERR